MEQDFLPPSKILDLQLESIYSMGDLNAGLAHEINNPLAIVLGQLELIKMMHGTNKLSNEVLLDKLEKLIAAGDKINLLIHKMNKLPKSTSSKLPIPFDVFMLIDNLHFFAIYPCKKAKIPLQLEVSEQLSGKTITGIWEEIFTALHFILKHIIDAQKYNEQKKLTIIATAEANEVKIQFEYPQIEYSHTQSKQVCEFICQKYQGHVHWHNDLVEISLPTNK